MKKIYLFGDSISIQYGEYLKSYLPPNIEYSRKTEEEEAELELDFSMGANGGDSSMVLAFLKAKKTHQSKAGTEGAVIDADILLLNCGLHDIKTDPTTGKKQVSLEDYRKNLEGILELVGRTGRPSLIWIRTTPVDDEVHNRPGMEFYRYASDCKTYNLTADEIMSAAGVPLIDLYGFTLRIGTAAERYRDHVHFTEEVRALQAAFIAGSLEAF